MTGEKLRDLLPEVLTDCLDCEILSVQKCNLPNYHRPNCNCGGITEKCISHGAHEGHRIQLRPYNQEDGTSPHRYYCNDCEKWAWE